MDHVKRRDCPKNAMPGRVTNGVVTPGGPVKSDRMMAAFAEFSYKHGKMETHRHQNEYMYIIDAKDAYVSYGMDLDNPQKMELHAGDIIRPVDGEWHRFDFTNDDGYVDFLNFFAIPATEIRVVNESEA